MPVSSHFPTTTERFHAHQEDGRSGNLRIVDFEVPLVRERKTLATGLRCDLQLDRV